MTAVYEWYDQAGTLLYIGISEDVTARAHRHEYDKAWWEEVARARVIHYPTREEALEVERVLIRHYQPLHNIRHNGYSVKRMNGFDTGGNRISLIIEAIDRLEVPPTSVNKTMVALREDGRGYRRSDVSRALRARAERERNREQNRGFDPSTYWVPNDDLTSADLEDPEDL